MEYLLGSLVTLACIVIVNKVFKKYDEREIRLNISFSQSRSFELIKDLLPYIPQQKEKLVSQSTKHFDETSLKILFINEDAFWITDNSVYTSKIIDGEVDTENKKKVDMMGMSKVELDKMIFIVDMLTEGDNNDSGNSRNKKL